MHKPYATILVLPGTSFVWFTLSTVPLGVVEIITLSARRSGPLSLSARQQGSIALLARSDPIAVEAKS